MSKKEIEKAAKSFEAFNESIESLTLDRMNKAPKEEHEEQTKLSNREIQKMDAPYLKPTRSINSKEPFNEKFRKDWERDWEYVKCIAENLEIIGEHIETWTKKYPGDPAHFWKIPVNKPVYMPRILAKRLSECQYHRLVMQDTSTNEEAGMTYYGALTVDVTKNRLDCRPVGNTLTPLAI